MRWVITAALGLLAACGTEPVHPPAAMFSFRPARLCEGDAHRTTVTLDGSASVPFLMIVPMPPAPEDLPLEYEWTIRGAAHRVVEGALDEPVVRLTSAGDRPLHVSLRVVNLEGADAITTRTIPLTLGPDCEGAP